MPRQERQSTAAVKPVDVLSQMNPDAAGLDIGAEEIFVCVPADRDEQLEAQSGLFGPANRYYTCYSTMCFLAA